MNAHQARLARQQYSWTTGRAAREAGVSEEAVKSFERGETISTDDFRSLRKMFVREGFDFNAHPQGAPWSKANQDYYKKNPNAAEPVGTYPITDGM